ncbi:MAG: transposase domain-containing protein [Enterovibrio sp.]
MFWSPCNFHKPQSDIKFIKNQVSSMLMGYSLVKTAKANGLIPYDYLVACFDEMCQPALDVERLLPWNFAQGVVG